MKRILIFVILILFCTTIFAQENGDAKSLQLELTSNYHTLRIGQSATVNLKIIGKDIANIIKDVNNITNTFNSTPEFVYQFTVKPSVEGDYKLGSYSLLFNGTNLISNSLTIKVLSEWKGGLGTFFRTDCNEINLGESFELVMETWAKEMIKSNLFAQYNPDLATIEQGRFFTQLSSKNNDVTYSSVKSWLITPKSIGDFKITKSFFREFPDEINPPQLIVHVKENEK